MLQLRSVLTLLASLAIVVAGEVAPVFAQQRGTTGTATQTLGTATGGAMSAAGGAGATTSRAATGGAAAGGGGPLVDTNSLGVLDEFGGGQGVGTSGFVGRNDTNTFIGRTGTTQGVATQQPNFSALGNRGGGGGQQFGASTQRNLKVVRPRLRIAFTHPTVPQGDVSQAVSTQLQKLQGRKQFEGIDVQVNEKFEVTLRGEVSSEADSKLLAIIARMEPGVRSVNNELTVRQTETPGYEK